MRGPIRSTFGLLLLGAGVFLGYLVTFQSNRFFEMQNNFVFSLFRDIGLGTGSIRIVIGVVAIFLVVYGFNRLFEQRAEFT